MTHINLRKPKEQEEPKRHRTSNNSIVGSSDIADVGKTSKQKAIQPNIVELDVVTSPENIPLPASLVPISSSEATWQVDKKSVSSVTFGQSSGCFPPSQWLHHLSIKLLKLYLAMMPEISSLHRRWTAPVWRAIQPRSLSPLLSLLSNFMS
ncbi:unnamed protein product [Fusarium graminearum]|nr:unnamed protein product [Fusarium graminearum]